MKYFVMNKIIKMIQISHPTQYFSIAFFFPEIRKRAYSKTYFRGVTWLMVAQKKKQKKRPI